MGNKEFAVATLDPEHETDIVYIGSVSSIALPSSSLLDVHHFCRLQIAGLIAKKASTKVFAKYLDFADVFSSSLAFKLFKHIGINTYTIKLVND